jgi:ribosomal protein S18 acetylase RimI-like enzyme
MSSVLPSQVVYFKRDRMECSLNDSLPPVPGLPAGYSWVRWDDDLLEAHAAVKYRCFVDEVDGIVFANLSSRTGCQRLMREIRQRSGFCADATWLLAHGDTFCGTIQGVSDRHGTGCIQNLGIVAEHRGRGLGKALLLQALHAFRSHGMHRAMLDVTAQNHAAVQLYRQLGFRYRKSLYRMVDMAERRTTDFGASEWVL